MKKLFELFRKLFGPTKDEDITVVPYKWEEYNRPHFLLPETQAEYEQMKPQFLPEAKVEFIPVRDAALRVDNAYTSAKAMYAHACKAYRAAEKTSYSSPLDREIAIRGADIDRWIAKRDLKMADEKKEGRVRESLASYYQYVRNHAAHRLKDKEESKIRSGQIIHEMRDRNNDPRVITHIGSLFFLVRKNKYPYVTESMSEMTMEELAAIKAYRAAHPTE